MREHRHASVCFALNSAQKQAHGAAAARRDWSVAACALLPIMLRAAERIETYSRPEAVEESLVGSLMMLCDAGLAGKAVRAGAGRVLALALRNTLVSAAGCRALSGAQPGLAAQNMHVVLCCAVLRCAMSLRRCGLRLLRCPSRPFRRRCAEALPQGVPRRGWCWCSAPTSSNTQTCGCPCWAAAQPRSWRPGQRGT